MKNILGLAAALLITTTSAFADTQYPREVVREGVIYNCEEPIVSKDGIQQPRRCVVADTSGNLFGGGLGVGAVVLLGLGGAAVVAAIANSNNDNNSANGTN